MKNIAVFGGSFNPPGNHHYIIAEILSADFDEVIIVPCGLRPDKPTTNDIHPTYRAAMIDMAFRNKFPNVHIDLFDLEGGNFTETHILEERYKHMGKIWHVVGSDLLEKSEHGDGKNIIQSEWSYGEDIWNNLNFAVCWRNSNRGLELPPNHKEFDTFLDGSSSEIRLNAFLRNKVSDLVNPNIHSYMEKYNLYRGIPNNTTELRLNEIRPLIIVDPFNKTQIDTSCIIEDKENPNIIIVIGGDGTMLRAIKSEWHRRLPFYGINIGHEGFLLNKYQCTLDPLHCVINKRLSVEKLPLLRIKTNGPEGNKTSLAFNEGWVERAGGQAAWLEVTINNKKRIERLVGDGALIGTAAGSTAYAKALGAHPLPMNTPALMFVGSNILTPSLDPMLLPLDFNIELRTLDFNKRPLRGYIDGTPLGEVYSMKAHVSNIASVELAFDYNHNAIEKLAGVQFKSE